MAVAEEVPLVPRRRPAPALPPRRACTRRRRLPAPAWPADAASEAQRLLETLGDGRVPPLDPQAIAEAFLGELEAGVELAIALGVGRGGR